MKSVNAGTVEIIKRLAEVMGRVELAEYQLEKFAEHSQYTLPEEVPDKEDGNESEGNETNNEEKHEGGA